jgi:hypothetical protein
MAKTREIRMNLKWQLALWVTLIDMLCFALLISLHLMQINSSFLDKIEKIWGNYLHYPLNYFGKILLEAGVENFSDKNWLLIVLGLFVMFSQSFWIAFLIGWGIESYHDFRKKK